MTQQSEQFCQQCHSNLQYIHALCQGSLDTPCLSHASFEANNLRLLAQSERRLILERYAQDLQYLCRELQNDHLLSRRQEDFAEFLSFGLQCNCRCEACVEMRFDQLLELESRLPRIKGPG